MSQAEGAPDGVADTRHAQYIARLDERRRRGWHRRWTVLGGVLLLAGVVALVLRIAALPGPLAVPTDPRLHYDPRGDYGTLQGTLHASRSGDRACFWVTPPPDAPSFSKVPTDRYYVVAPADWSADESLRLLGGFKVVIASPGEELLLVGAPGGVRTLPGCPSSGAVFLTVQAYQP